MNDDNITEVNSQSWFSRIGSSIKGILFGIILIIISVALLFWNEGRAVKTAKSLREGTKSVISVSSQTVNAVNQGKLIHISGYATTNDILKDAEFGISENAIKLKRKSEMYQWRETKKSDTHKKLGGGTETVTTYSYDKRWEDNLIRSSGFRNADGHRNPENMPYQSRTYQADNVSVGEFLLSDGLISQMNNYQPLVLDNTHKEKASANLYNRLKITDGRYYIGNDPYNPAIGDIRITYEIVPHSDVSIIAEQSGNSLKPYMTKVGRKLEMLSIGSHSADEMFKDAQSQNTILTWILRFAGFIMMGIGFSMIFSPMSVLADVIPLMGDIVGAGTGFISFSLSAAISLITISIGWIFYRPLFGIILIVCAALPVIWIVMLLKKKKG